jgi:hypothetical protein
MESILVFYFITSRFVRNNLEKLKNRLAWPCKFVFKKEKQLKIFIFFDLLSAESSWAKPIIKNITGKNVFTVIVYNFR